jgi:hypothetical protein
MGATYYTFVMGGVSIPSLCFHKRQLTVCFACRVCQSTSSIIATLEAEYCYAECRYAEYFYADCQAPSMFQWLKPGK